MTKARKRTGKTKIGTTDATANLAALTWNDLEQWAGSRSVQRGRTYQRQGRVHDMGISQDGQLLATVIGTQRYVVSVGLTIKGKNAVKLESQCTCPVGSNGCKHAVATVVCLLKQLGDGHSISEVSADDRRWAILANDAIDGDFESFDDDFENEQNDESFLPVPKIIASKTKHGKTSLTTAQWDEKITTYIQQKSREELATFVTALVERFPELRQELTERIMLDTGDGDQLLREARKEMRRVTAEIGWQNHWDYGGHIPDYSKLKHKLECLVEMGCADQVITLGSELMERGIEQINQSNDEGETTIEIAECMVVVFHALLRSSLSTVEQIKYVIDANLLDGYEIIGDAADPVLALDKPQDWSEVADWLRFKLDKLPGNIRHSDYTQRYHRDHVSDWLIRALQKAGREDELQHVHEAEAKAMGSYQRLVTFLLEKGEDQAAFRWASEGIQQTRESGAGSASSLVKSLCEMARRQKQWDTVAAHAAYDFFSRPNRQTFQTLIEAARKAKCVRQVQAMAMSFLETGISPIKVSRDRKDQVKLTIDASWPLPVPDYLQSLWPQESQRTHWDVLLDMALDQKRPKDVLHWYDRMNADTHAKGWYGAGRTRQEQVADAVAQSHPQRALEIRQKQLAELLPQTGVRAYESCAACLIKIKPLLAALKRHGQWDHLLTEIREKYKNRPRFMEVLDKFDGRTILQTSQTRLTKR